MQAQSIFNKFKKHHDGGISKLDQIDLELYNGYLELIIEQLMNLFIFAV